MSFIPQSLINTLVILMTIAWVSQFASTLLSSDPGYYEGLPDEVEVIDNNILQVMESVDTIPNLVPTARTTTSKTISFNTFTPSNPLSATEVYERTQQSVVYINTFAFGNEIDGFGSGSILGSNGIILTNYHVVEGAEKIAVTLASGETYPVIDVLAVDPTKDIALLQIDAEELPAIPTALVDAVNVGDTVYGLGHPENYLFTFSVGIVSGIREYLQSGQGVQIQFTAPISEGSSGGALFNNRGQLIGISTATLHYDANSVQVQNINFATVIDSVLDLLEAQ